MRTTPKKQIAFNKQIVELVTRRVDEGSAFTPMEIKFIQRYSGDGGLVKGSRGMLYEFYTPYHVAGAMWALAFKYGFVSGNILEPSCGTGRFLHFIDPTNNYVDAFEWSEEEKDTSYQIAKATYPFANIQNAQFESIFYKGNKRVGTDKRYDLIIGNPPYGKFDGYYKVGESKKFFKSTRYDQYFLWAGAELLNDNGIMIMIVPSTFLGNTGTYDKFKQDLSEKVDLIDAYRMPIGLFDYTSYETDILVFKKQTNE